jgi:hypothetical protein
MRQGSVEETFSDDLTSGSKDLTMEKPGVQESTIYSNHSQLISLETRYKG